MQKAARSQSLEELIKLAIARVEFWKFHLRMSFGCKTVYVQFARREKMDGIGRGKWIEARFIRYVPKEARLREIESRQNAFTKCDSAIVVEMIRHFYVSSL